MFYDSLNEHLFKLIVNLTDHIYWDFVLLTVNMFISIQFNTMSDKMRFCW